MLGGGSLSIVVAVSQIQALFLNLCCEGCCVYSRILWTSEEGCTGTNADEKAHSSI